MDAQPGVQQREQNRGGLTSSAQMSGQSLSTDAETADTGLKSPEGQRHWLHVVNRGLTNLLKENPDKNDIFDWIEHNVGADHRQTDDFIRALVTIICRSAIEGEGQNCHIAQFSLKQRCTVLKRYIDNIRSTELQALYAVQAINHSLQNPPGLLGTIFDLLYDEDVISEEAFYDWKKSEDPREQAGKGVALKSATKFFDWLSD